MVESKEGSVMSSLTSIVVGAGAGGMLSAKALLASPRFTLVGIADTSPEALGRLDGDDFRGVAKFDSYQDMFGAVQADVVCVSTYAPTHLEIAQAAMALPVRGMLVEKPLGDSTTAGSEIVEFAKSHKIPLVTPHGLMARDAPLEVLAEVRKGAIGALRVVEMECTGWDIINAGIHWIQYFIMLARPEPVTSVLCACDTGTRTYRDGLQVETEAVTLAVCGNGTRLILNTGDYVPVARDNAACLMRIVGEDGYIEYCAWQDSYRLVTPNAGNRVVAVEPSPVSGHRRHLEHLADLIDSGTVDYEVPDSSVRALEVVEAAYLSNRTGASVSLPIATFQKPAATDWDPGTPYSGVGGGRDGRKLP
jgi:predicted dehydrogenase